MKLFITATAVMVALIATPLAAENRIDGLSLDAPALSPYGDLSVGVRRFDFVNQGQVNIAGITSSYDPSTPLPLYDRPLAVEMWYPSVSGSTGNTTINTFLRDGTTAINLEGRAVRDAEALVGPEPLPLIILSHGYPGNRFLMSHFAENLASKGYVVASIDHTDSTYNDISAFGSTLVNRPLDQVFVLNELAKLNADPASGLTGLIDTNNTGLIGYSMGGYGTLISAGAGVTKTALPWAPAGTLGIHQAESDKYEPVSDSRIKTAVAIGPWGRQVGFFDEESLSGIDIPMLYIAGSDDATSGYATGVRKLWEETVNADRALLTFEGGGHNTVAPIPAPEESDFFSDALGFNVSEHYTDDVWDTVFMNNVGQHFTTAWFDQYLKGDASKGAYLNLGEIGSDGVWSVNDDGTFGDDHTYWAGFLQGTAAGLKFETLSAAVAPVPLPATAWLLAMAVGGIGFARKRRHQKS